MPELPEVETVKKTLQKLISGKTIEEGVVTLPRIIQEPPSPDLFQEMLKGQTIHDVGRRGKFLRIFLDTHVLVSHLRMEGRYHLAMKDEPIEKHTHVRFCFTDGTELRYKDVRQFGTMHLYPLGEDLKRPPLAKLGPEPLSEDFTLAGFQRSLSGRRTKIKSLLLNQAFLSGLGNIYVDEALFGASILPERLVESLTPDDVERLYTSIRSVLSTAVEAGGSSVRSYVDGNGEMGMFQLQIKVYGRKGEACHQCGEPIQRIVVTGRGTHFCTTCQH
ncbi:DNA-(apurinic or apyrimidinic site) lyase [Marininema mesophilum]|uniref:Formamidopyrimidine-DNA glycosylase n=1 Tax=Marininema mesophilum TaxID=1048340 RepID=A0A1H2XSA6_9BACL|nr:DNA-formamidopyrimidine glycosylase [Marininema mesophilum]SDW95665.1 DNA-(apurinic or apyrimidinic site) lyase [Marininema mesophilum]